MTSLIFLIPIALGICIIGLIAFFWTVKIGQYDDPKGDAARMLYTDDTPIVDEDDLLCYFAPAFFQHPE